ncbi:hypothetical protein SHIRM173S_02006 [Streptomyces hirsutus]
MARSMAYAFAVVLIERVPSEAARASRPTASTPGSPCRKRRSVLSDAVTSLSAAGAPPRSGAGEGWGEVGAVEDMVTSRAYLRA